MLLHAVNAHSKIRVHRIRAVSMQNGGALHSRMLKAGKHVLQSASISCIAIARIGSVHGLTSRIVLKMAMRPMYRVPAPARSLSCADLLRW